jgi:hypothetical protein
MLRLSKSEVRRAQRQAAEEFFLRRGRPSTQFRPPDQQQQEEEKKPAAPATQVVPDWRESKEILKRLLAEGQLKQSRK